MAIIDLLYYACFIVLISLTAFVFQKNPKDWLNRYFALLALSIFGWLITLYFFNRTVESPLLIIIGRANFTFPLFIVLFNSLFLPYVIRRNNRFTGVLVTETLVLALITQFSGLVDYSEHIKSGQHITVFGPLFYLYTLHIALYLLSAIYFTFLSKNKTTRKEQGQLAIIGIGTIIMASIAFTTNIVLPYGFNIFKFQELGALSTIAIIISFTYAITMQHLFDVKIIIRKTIIYSGLLIAVTTLYSLVAYYITSFLGNPATLNLKFFIPNIIVAIFISIGFDPLKKWLQNRTDQYLYKKEYEQQVVLKDLTQKLNGVIVLDEALEIMMQIIVKAFHLKHAVTYVFQRGENGLPVVKRIKQIGYSSNANLILSEKDFLVEYFSEHNEVTLLKDLKITLEHEKIEMSKNTFKDNGNLLRNHAIKSAVCKKLESMGASLIIPLHINLQPIGLITLSDKLSQETYNHQDLDLIDLIGEQAIGAIEKAKLYEVDQIKNEFVSIASHELLTPISAMEGYLSMILEENLGKVDKQAKDYLEKVYTSAKRLSVLVKDLLSVSRIESGNLKFAPQVLDIEKIIQDCIDQLKFIAKAKEIELINVKSVRPLPNAFVDQDRTVQVMINLLSNAIKYTKKGTVTILPSYLPHSSTISIEIRDTGIGMSKTEQAHLFEKFYRVDSPDTTGIIGTGLGLYITRSIIEKMGGNISVKSTAGQGSSFTFTLPIYKVELSTI